MWRLTGIHQDIDHYRLTPKDNYDLLQIGEPNRWTLVTTLCDVTFEEAKKLAEPFMKRS